MKILDTTLIVDPGVQQPFTGPSLLFIQNSYKETLNALARVGIIDASKVTVLYGCVNSTPGTATFTLSAGALYYNGEIYLVPAATLVTAGPNIVVANLVDTNTLGNQTFSDGVARTTSHDRTAVFALGATGTGTLTGATTASDFTNFELMNTWRTYTPTLSADDGTSPVVGGFTGTATGRYLFNGATLKMKMSVISVAILATVRNLNFSLPVTPLNTSSTPISPYNMEGFNVAKRGDISNSAYTAQQVSIGIRHTGSGSGLAVSKLDGTAFAASANGTVDFEITIDFRRDGY